MNTPTDGSARFRLRGWHLALVLALAALFSLFYKGLWGDPSALPTVLIGTPAPAFAGPEVVNGQPVSLTEFRGKVVLINFWASWCQECRVEHEQLLALYKQFSPHPDFVMLGVDYQDKPDDARRYLEVYGAPWLNVRDLKGAISIDYGVYGVPETFVIDRQGIIRHKQIGPIIGPAYDYLSARLLPALLDGAAPAVS
jgi:cytochrome c biogenesis protein CcmG/thiol:disulfide interchange protein DsbE